MADVAQLVRALDCGSGGRGFDPHHSPQINSPEFRSYLFCFRCYPSGPSHTRSLPYTIHTFEACFFNILHFLNQKRIIVLVPREGFEPPTKRIEAACSNPLSYRGTRSIVPLSCRRRYLLPIFSATLELCRESISNDVCCRVSSKIFVSSATSS